MNLRAFRLPGLLICLAPLFVRAATTQPGGGIPPAVKNSDAFSEDQKRVIGTFISGQVVNLAIEDPAAPGTKSSQQMAREALIAEIPMPLANQPDPTTLAFKMLYDSELSAAIMNPTGPIAKGTVRTRLNAAIVVANVAKVAPYQPLQPAILSLMNGKGNFGAVIWALRAARPVIEQSFRISQPNKELIKAIGPAAAANPGPEVAREAYDALNVDPSISPQLAVENTVPALLDFYNSRLAVYNATIDPAQIEVEASPLLKLFGDALWKIMLPDQRQKALGTTTKLVASIKGLVGQNVEAQQFSYLLKYMVDCLKTPVSLIADPTLKDKLTTEIEGITLPINAKPADVQVYCDAITHLMAQIK